MRLAILADIHGNPIALDAVLDDINGQVDEYLFLGDYAAIGFDPATVIKRVRELPNARFVRGNTDHYTCTGDRPFPSPDDVLADPTLMPLLLDIQAGFTWTQGFLAAHGLLDWLAALPVEERITLPDGTRLLGVHAAPGRFDGTGFHDEMSDDELWEMVADCQADIVTVGHYHWPMDRTLNGIRCINVGPVSNPNRPDKRASYVMIEADEKGYQIEFRRVAYDIDAVLAANDRSGHPTVHFNTHFWRE